MRLTILVFSLLIFGSSASAQICCDTMGSGQQQQFGSQQQEQPGMIPTPNGGALFPPITKDAYGPGAHSDATGRPFYFTPPNGMTQTNPDPTLQVDPHRYGLGKGGDQYGRPVEPKCFGMNC